MDYSTRFGPVIALSLLLVGVTVFLAPLSKAAGDRYLIGTGKADITGPVVEIGLAGYADPKQVGTGLRQRLYSRAFVVADISRPSDRFAYLVIDTQSGDTAVRYGVLDGLRALGEDYLVYGHRNVALTGTHSHAGPGAWFNYLLPQITSFGFDRQSYQAIVDGAVRSLRLAHESLEEGYLDVGTTIIRDGAVNRSPFSYGKNPKAERDRYEAETDKTMTLLRFMRASDNKTTGILTWFPVHGTSLYANNTHVAADNKGVAAWLLETAMKDRASAADGFVAAFSQANVGDTSPNVLGAYCDDGSGHACSRERSTCADGRSQKCHGRGPAFRALDHGVSSCYEMGRRQFVGAMTIYDSLESRGISVKGPVKAFHRFHDMRFWSFSLPNGTMAMTCPAALGYSFAAGTSDGPGAFDFTQGDAGKPDANPLWKLVSNLVRKPSAEQQDCHGAKPILLDVGEMEKPYAWAPNRVDVQTLRLGQVLIIVSPCEATTMSGRRWKQAVADEAVASSLLGTQSPIVLLAGPANSYAHYCTTAEEYEVQRYEGASTLYGRHQLDALINLTLDGLVYLRSGSGSADPGRGEAPPDNRRKAISLIPPVARDAHPLGRPFGRVLQQPKRGYQVGAVVKATFQGANPRNNLRLEQTFAAVERRGSDGSWQRVRDDADWFLVFSWRRTSWLLGYSETDITWETAGNAEAGTYRIRYYGDAKTVLGSVKTFEGSSRSFDLTD